MKIQSVQLILKLHAKHSHTFFNQVFCFIPQQYVIGIASYTG